MVDQKKYEFVDALRGVAVLLVILAHTLLPNDLTFLNVLGAYGVQLFFVLSAFTLFHSLNAKTERELYPVLFFFIRRFFRIAPAFYLAGVFYLLKDGAGPTPFAPDGIKAWQMLTTLTFVNGWFPDAINAIVPGGWSIAVEMTFYVFVPTCFLFITSISRALALTIVLAALGIAANKFIAPMLLASFQNDRTILVWFPQLWFPIQACVFPVGFVLFFLIRSRPDEAKATVTTRATVWISVVMLLLLAKLHTWIVPAPLAYAVVFGFLAYGLSFGRLRVFVNPLLCTIGRVSFSVYLLHFWAIDLVREYVAWIWIETAPGLGSALSYLATVLLAVTLAIVAFMLVEKPGQRLGRTIIRRIEVAKYRCSTV